MRRPARKRRSEPRTLSRRNVERLVADSFVPKATEYIERKRCVGVKWQADRLRRDRHAECPWCGKIVREWSEDHLDAHRLKAIRALRKRRSRSAAEEAEVEDDEADLDGDSDFWGEDFDGEDEDGERGAVEVERALLVA